MNFSEFSDKIMDEFNSILQQVDEKSAERMLEGILFSERIFLFGMGRSGLVIYPFAMRLMQMEVQVYMVGDATTPAIRKGDLLIVVSGSGETSVTYHVATRAKSFGAQVYLITCRTESRISGIADLALVLPETARNILPLRSAFEGGVYIFFDVLVNMIMERKGITRDEMMKRHSNLE
jgi:6-phospho-3-hexuloisomerase